MLHLCYKVEPRALISASLFWLMLSDIFFRKPGEPQCCPEGTRLFIHGKMMNGMSEYKSHVASSVAKLSLIFFSSDLAGA